MAKDKGRDEGGWGKLIRDIIVILLLVLGIHSCVAKPFYIPSDSMMPVLRNGDRLIVSKYPYGWSYASASFHLLPKMEGRIFAKMPERGDIVVLEHPVDRTDYIKRVIGLPGDVVEIRSNQVYVNGEPLDEPYLTPSRNDDGFSMAPFALGADEYFVMGDNRDESYDSRFWGFVERNTIAGKALVLYWSWASLTDIRWDRIGRMVE